MTDLDNDQMKLNLLQGLSLQKRSHKKINIRTSQTLFILRNIVFNTSILHTLFYESAMNKIFSKLQGFLLLKTCIFSRWLPYGLGQQMEDFSTSTILSYSQISGLTNDN